jgi:Zn-dependent M16 (insulinase) family peptidase
MSDKAKEFLAERGIPTNEMVEGAYGSAYYIEGMLETFANQSNKSAEIKKMLLAFRELASNYVNGQVDDDAIDKFIEELNQNKDKDETD